MTPEGKVKAAVSKLVAAYLPNVYKYMPVPAGYGPSSLDYIMCVNGMFCAIETKAPGKKLTPRQEKCVADIRAAGGIVFVIDGTSKAHLHPLKEFLEHQCKSK